MSKVKPAATKDPAAPEPRLTLSLTQAEAQIYGAALDIAIKATGGSNPQATMAFATQIARLQAEAQAAFGAPQT